LVREEDESGRWDDGAKEPVLPFRPVAYSPTRPLADFSRGAACRAVEFVFQHGQPIAWGDDQHHWEKALAVAGSSGATGSQSPDSVARAAYLPLATEDHILGVLYLELEEGQVVVLEERRVVESLANHAAVVLERDRLARAATQTQALAEAD